MGYKWNTSDVISANRLNQTGSVIITGVAGEAMDSTSKPKAVYYSNGAWYYSNASTTADAKIDGFLVYGQSVSSGADIRILVAGDVIGFSGLTNGRYFLADTDGEIQTTSGTIQVYAGKAVDTDKFIFNTGTVLDERPTVKQIDCILNASHNYDGTICVMGVSDNDNFAIGSVNPATPTETLIFRLEFNFLQQYQEIVITDQQVDTTTDAIGVLYIGDYYWLIDSTGSGLIKNGSTVTISGTTPTNIYALGYDGNNDYLLILESSTSVKRYSISGTTITYVDTITLDAAVSTINGFLFDKENNEFVFIGIGDIRIFNASGTTQRTITYPRIKGYGGLNGVVYYRNYLYAVYQMNYYGTRGSNTVTVNTISLIPLDIIRY